MTATASGRGYSAHLHRRSGSPQADGEASHNRYAVLMKVTVRHDYYNNLDGRCPDFEFAPTDDSAALMHRLGLLFPPERMGFSILYRSSQEHRERLINFLNHQRTDKGSRQVWTRLSIILTCVNPYCTWSATRSPSRAGVGPCRSASHNPFHRCRSRARTALRRLDRQHPAADWPPSRWP